MNYRQLNLAAVTTIQAKPFLKWVGGKSQLLSQFEDFYPTELKQGKIEKYFENYSLDWISRVAMLIFLNRTCFNGLFRLNSKGLFNVPHGRYKNPRILDEENLMAVSQLLKGAEIKLGDFEICEKAITSNSFIYFDPPYRPLSKTSSFTSYSTFNFDDQQQTRLANFFRYLDSKYNVKMMLSNSDPKNQNPQDNFFEDLYQGFNIQQVSASRMINSKAEGRGKIDEIVITNY